ncbi:MAG: flagellar basal body P-ring formation chaperone FlgA [Terriglobia bacterium]
MLFFRNTRKTGRLPASRFLSSLALRRRGAAPFALLTAVCAMAFGECLPVTGDRILGSDLAHANLQFAALPPNLTLGFTPAPGMTRIFAAAELTRIAKANGLVAGDSPEVCFAIPMRRLTPAEATGAMARSLPAGVKIAIVEMSSSDVPVGEAEFPLAGLETTAGPAQLWHGSVKFTATRKSPVWARVTVTQEMKAVVTNKDLPPNTPIDASSIHLTTWTGPLLRERVADRLEDVLGKMSKRAVKAGEPIPLGLLNFAPAVRRGESIRVEVNSGSAHLTFRAIAEKDGRDGDSVELRNPATGKLFQARLTGSTAVIFVDKGTGL